jgi:hypothetical protein
VVHDLIEVALGLQLICSHVPTEPIRPLSYLRKQDCETGRLGVPVEDAILACEFVLVVELLGLIEQVGRVGGHGEEERGDGYVVAEARGGIALGHSRDAGLIGVLTACGVEGEGVELLGVVLEDLGVRVVLQGGGASVGAVEGAIGVEV